MPYPVDENIFYPGDLTWAEEAFFLYWGISDVGTSPLHDESIAIVNNDSWGGNEIFIGPAGTNLGTYESQGYQPDYFLNAVMGYSGPVPGWLEQGIFPSIEDSFDYDFYSGSSPVEGGASGQIDYWGSDVVPDPSIFASSIAYDAQAVPGQQPPSPTGVVDPGVEDPYRGIGSEGIASGWGWRPEDLGVVDPGVGAAELMQQDPYTLVPPGGIGGLDVSQAPSTATSPVPPSASDLDLLSGSTDLEPKVDLGSIPQDPYTLVPETGLGGLPAAQVEDVEPDPGEFEVDPSLGSGIGPEERSIINQNIDARHYLEYGLENIEGAGGSLLGSEFSGMSIPSLGDLATDEPGSTFFQYPTGYTENVPEGGYPGYAFGELTDPEIAGIGAISSGAYLGDEAPVPPGFEGVFGGFERDPFGADWKFGQQVKDRYTTYDVPGLSDEDAARVREADSWLDGFYQRIEDGKFLTYQDYFDSLSPAAAIQERNLWNYYAPIYDDLASQYLYTKSLEFNEVTNRDDFADWINEPEGIYWISQNLLGLVSFGFLDEDVVFEAIRGGRDSIIALIKRISIGPAAGSGGVTINVIDTGAGDAAAAAAAAAAAEQARLNAENSGEPVPVTIEIYGIGAVKDDGLSADGYITYSNTAGDVASYDSNGMLVSVVDANEDPIAIVRDEDGVPVSAGGFTFKRIGSSDVADTDVFGDYEDVSGDGFYNNNEDLGVEFWGSGLNLDLVGAQGLDAPDHDLFLSTVRNMFPVADLVAFGDVDAGGTEGYWGFGDIGTTDTVSGSLFEASADAAGLGFSDTPVTGLDETAFNNGKQTSSYPRFIVDAMENNNVAARAAVSSMGAGSDLYAWWDSLPGELEARSGGVNYQQLVKNQFLYGEGVDSATAASIVEEVDVPYTAGDVFVYRFDDDDNELGFSGYLPDWFIRDALQEEGRVPDIADWLALGPEERAKLTKAARIDGKSTELIRVVDVDFSNGDYTGVLKFDIDIDGVLTTVLESSTEAFSGDLEKLGFIPPGMTNFISNQATSIGTAFSVEELVNKETDFPGANPRDLRHNSGTWNGWQGGTYFTVSGLGQQLIYMDQFKAENGHVNPLGFGGLNGHGNTVARTTSYDNESDRRIDNQQAYREQLFGLAEVSVLIDNLGAYTSYLGVEDGDILPEELLDAGLGGTHWIGVVDVDPGATGSPSDDIRTVDVLNVINNTRGSDNIGTDTYTDDLTYGDLEYVGSGVNEDFDGEGNSKGFNFVEYLFGSDEKNAKGETWGGIIETRTDPSGVKSFYLGDLDISVETNQTLDGLYAAENRPNTTRFTPDGFDLAWDRTPIDAWVPQNQKDMNNIVMAWFYELMGNYLPAYNQMMVNYHEAHGGLVLGTDYPTFDQWIELGFGPESPDLAGMSPLQAASAAKDGASAASDLGALGGMVG